MPSGRRLRALKGHAEDVLAVAFHPAGQVLASVSFDGTVRLWDVATGTLISILEGHTDAVRALSVSHDGRVLASTSWDGTVRVWDTGSGECAVVLPVPAGREWATGVAFHPRQPILATVGSGEPAAAPDGDVVYLWKLNIDRLLRRRTARSVSYTTAKVVLVGDAGVGKTGLGWRLAHDEFVEHSSTHGQQFWLLDQLGGTAADGTERDAILWDLAGQPDYRLIHALYLDDADLALVLFNPAHDEDPLRGVEYWLRQLGRSSW